MEILLALSIAMLAGLLLSRLAKLIQLPAVTAYLVAGILVGPYCLGKLGVAGIGFISLDNVKEFELLCDIALGFIAFSIGNEFRLSSLKKIGKQATVIGIVQAVVATLLVDAVLIVVHLILGDKFPLPVAIVLGAVASATAPAATLMVVKQYKAKGPLTDILLPVVALDDAVGLVLFAVSFGIAKAFEAGKIDLVSVILDPILEVVLSLALGAVMGFLFTQAEKLFHSRSKRMAMSVTFVLLTVAISKIPESFELEHFAFSPLLVCMMLGTVFCNICDFSEELMDRIDRWVAPIFILFFVLSGAELELKVFEDITIVVIGLLYIIARSAGKYLGSYISAKATKCSPTIIKYLGITLLPQAGVALGMALKAKDAITGGTLISNITLFAVLIYEIFGPLLTKICLLRAGEIIPEHKTTQRHEANKNAKV